MKVTSMKRYSRISRRVTFTGEKKEIKRNATKLRTFLRNRGKLLWKVTGPYIDEDRPSVIVLYVSYSPSEDKKVIEAINEKGRELGFQISV